MAGIDLKQRVARRLQELGMGPVEAAKSVPGLERNYIRDLLEGKKQSFQNTKLDLVAQALKWSVNDLLGKTVSQREKSRDGPDDAFWSIWESAGENERRMIREIARTIVKIGIK